MACGIIEDTSEITVTYTYILKNQRGITLQITSDFGIAELVSNGNSFQCETIANPGYIGGFCSGDLEIRIPNSDKGYHCVGSPLPSKGLCFTDDDGLFTISSGTIFTEIKTQTYEYVLTTEILDGVFGLPK